MELDAHLETLAGVAAARPGDPLGENSPASSPAPTSRNSRSSTSAGAGRRAGARGATHPRSTSSPCPARRSPSSTASRSVAASSSRSPAVIASASSSDNFSIGLPEVMLGIHPGFGGTVRAVRLAGVRTAMEMMLTGKTLRADKAQARGLPRPAGVSGRCRSRRPRADQPPARATAAPAARSRAVVAAGRARW